MEMKLKLKPWIVPNFVCAEARPGLRQDGMAEPPKWHVSECDVETLDAMCREFRRGVFANAKKDDPSP